MLDSVVITLSLITAFVCAVFYVVRNRDFRNYVSGGGDLDEGDLIPDECSTEGESR